MDVTTGEYFDGVNRTQSAIWKNKLTMVTVRAKSTSLDLYFQMHIADLWKSEYLLHGLNSAHRRTENNAENNKEV